MLMVAKAQASLKALVQYSETMHYSMKLSIPASPEDAM